LRPAAAEALDIGKIASAACHEHQRLATNGAGFAPVAQASHRRSVARLSLPAQQDAREGTTFPRSKRASITRPQAA